MRRLLTLFLLVLFAGPAPVRAGELLPDYARRVWHVQDGLHDQVIQALVQTPDHMLWIGTTKGLIQFDGHDFSSYRGPGETELTHGVTTLLVARDQSLYIGTEGGGLLRYQSGKMQIYGVKNGLANSIVRALLQDRNGQLYVSTDHGCFHSTAHGFAPISALFETQDASALLQDSHGAIWLGGSRLYKLTTAGTQQFPFPAQYGSMRIKSLFEDADGSIWVGSVAGLFHQQKNGQFVRASGIDRAVLTFGRLPDGSMWAGTAGAGLYVRSGSSFIAQRSSETLPSNTILSQTMDLDGNLWIGTQAGLARYSRTGIHLTPLPDKNDSDFGSLMRDRDGTLWACSSQLFRMRNGQLQGYRFPGIPDVLIRTMMRARDGALWLGTAGKGAYRIDPAGRIQNFTSAIGTNYIRAFLQARDGGVWIATDGGIARFQSGRMINYHENMHAPNRQVQAIAEGNQGELWIGTLRGLFLMKEGRFVDPDPAIQFRDEEVLALHMGGDGALWIGTANGLFRYHNGHLHHFQDLLGGPATAVYHIMESGNLLWVSGPTRAARFSLSALRLIAENNQQIIPPHQLFLVSNEIPAAELYGGVQPAGILESANSIWLPSTAGPVHITTWARGLQGAIPLRFLHLLADGQPLDTNHAVELPASASRLQFDIAPIQPGPQDGLLFRHRLEGFDDWSPLNDARAAEYVNLPPGRYTLRVQLFRPDSGEPVSELSLTIVQRAHFYQNLWFWMLCPLLAAIVGYGVLRLREQQIRTRLRAVAEERNRMAREMHDTLLQGCIGVSTLLEARASQTGDIPADPLLDCARQQVSLLIKQTRDAMWDLRSHKMEQCNLQAHARELVSQHLRSAGIATEVKLNGPDLVLDYRMAYELLMGMREAMLNIAAHSQATRAQLRIVCTERALRILLADNGIGFSPHAELARDNGHYGLKGMRERILGIGGTMRIVSQPGRGTLLFIRIPASALHIAAESQNRQRHLR